MYGLILKLLNNAGLEKYTDVAAYILTVAIIFIGCLVARFILRFILVRIMSRISKRTKYVWDDILLKNKLFHRLADISVPVVLSLLGAGLPDYNNLLGKAADIASVIVFLLILSALLNSVDEIYRQFEVSKIRPIRSILQVVKVAASIVCGIIGVAILAGQSPLVLLGGIGAMTAVTSLIFKDAIVGFVAGIQLTANDMIRIGDWIDVPGCAADGVVVDLSMTTVKVQNFDKTITSIPAYTLVSQSFINWRGMTAAGGRRIKRSLYIDAADVRLCDDAMLRRFRGMALLREYIDSRLADIERYNQEQGCDLSEPVNGRRITNIGTFRAYINAYLRQHPHIRRDMPAMVRQLSPDDRGLPLELYAFTDTTVWAEYETIQADIFDHLYSVVSAFGLRIYQRPSSNDVRSLALSDIDDEH